MVDMVAMHKDWSSVVYLVFAACWVDRMVGRINWGYR
jgi:hypothetical protein